ncbi:fatty acyl-AMP ligase [Amycolatopsis sp. H20-H5]|uniref:fatty acyl-AMP ligase n=1 Tax=Amycolatopsis sp. H20-H5 TaxID=3046309 RepID=UPI002DBC387A|nr:fatty acyl-AMP ligase [Amycolatopsis sp. H20-H5]MEC3975525.1 fatty acyl-AMP ligase [Amycolatopsis sp. H20-H5]
MIELVREQAAARSTRPALLVAGETAADADVSLTFRELDEAARRIASWLQERCRPGARVLVLQPGGVEFGAAFIGCLYAGMIAVPAPMPGRYQSQQRRLIRIAHDAGIAAVLTESAELSSVAQWARDHGLAECALLATDDRGAADPEAWSDPGTPREALALLQYTSGSTSEPKAVAVSHRNLLHNIDSLMNAFGAAEPVRFGGWIPMYHDMGLIGLMLPGLLLGGGSALINPTAFLKRPFRWLQVIDEHDVVVSAAPTFGYERCARQLTDAQVSSLDLSRWEFACCGSEPVRASTLRDFVERLAPAGFRATSFFPCYGLAEATLLVTGEAGRAPVTQRVVSDLLEDHVFVPSTSHVPERELVGLGAQQGLEIRIVDPETRQVLPPDRVGEIWVRGDSVARGYWRNPAATAATFDVVTSGGETGFLRTGDLGAMFDGELYVTGRLKDMLLVNGRNLYPQDIEYEIVAQHEELASLAGAVFAVDGTDREQIVVVQEIRSNDAELVALMAIAIRATVAREFGVRVAPVVLVRPNTVLRTTSGKVRRAAMREAYLAGELKPARQAELTVTWTVT